MSSMTGYRGVRCSYLARPLVTLFFLDLTESAEYIKSAPYHPSSYSAYFQVSNGLKVFFKSVTSKNTPRLSSGAKTPATGEVFANSHKLAGPQSHKS